MFKWFLNNLGKVNNTNDINYTKIGDLAICYGAFKAPKSSAITIKLPITYKNCVAISSLTHTGTEGMHTTATFVVKDSVIIKAETSNSYIAEVNGYFVAIGLV